MKYRGFTTRSAKETQKIAAALAKKIEKKGSTLDLKKGRTLKRALVIGLEGELGAGKTTFIKGFARALGVREKILSPTFVLMKTHKLGKSAIHLPENHKFLIHIDAYRLKDHQDLASLGIKEILENPENIILIEWSDRVEKILPKQYMKIHMDHIEENIRKIRVLT